MDKHKEQALSNDCVCGTCPIRFQCFTQERVFSDPIYQALFEVLMAQGKSRDESLEEVATELRNRTSFPQMGTTGTTTWSYPNTTAPVLVQHTSNINEYGWKDVAGASAIDGSSNVSINDFKITYTMHNGKEISLDDSKVRIYLQRRRHPNCTSRSGKT